MAVREDKKAGEVQPVRFVSLTEELFTDLIPGDLIVDGDGRLHTVIEPLRILGSREIVFTWCADPVDPRQRQRLQLHRGRRSDPYTSAMVTNCSGGSGVSWSPSSLQYVLLDDGDQ